MNTIYKVKENPLVYHPTLFKTKDYLFPKQQVAPKLTFTSYIDQPNPNKNTIVDNLTRTVLKTFFNGNGLNTVQRKTQNLKTTTSQINNTMKQNYQLYTIA